MLGQLIGEVFGTFILILLGDGVVANVGLGFKNGFNLLDIVSLKKV